MSIDRIELMTLDTFTVTPQNREQYDLCRELAFHPELFRLVLIHLPSHERFHLKHALLNHWGDRVDWRSITISDFASDLVNEIWKGSFPYDLRHYVEPDVLLVDDLQHIAGKESTQEEFYKVILKQRLEGKKLTILFSEVGLDQLRVALRDDLAHLLTLG